MQKQAYETYRHETNGWNVRSIDAFKVEHLAFGHAVTISNDDGVGGLDLLTVTARPTGVGWRRVA